jgi:hypothetical protein
MSQIKSKDRVRDLAEVYTNEREVNAMLDLIPLDHPDDIIAYKYLEPACGNGNFLIEILRRKLRRVNEKYADKPLKTYEFYIARALSTIYGIDICKLNVQEARQRLLSEVKSNYDLHKGSYIYSKGFLPLIEYILEMNIVEGDSINKPEQITFIDYKVKGKRFERRFYDFSTLVQKNPQPIEILPLKYFLEIGKEYQLQIGAIYEGEQGHLKFI